MQAMSKKMETVMVTECGESVWKQLLSRIEGLGGLTVAYSGGIDSRFLVHAAIHAGVSVELMHVCGPHVAPAETCFALDWACAKGLAVRMLRLDPLTLPEVAAGGRERCYACKRSCFEQIMSMAGGRVCDGSNVSDAAQYRPGRRALREMGVLSPLAEAGLTKIMIRALARRTGLVRPEQQARACLLTRLPYGRTPDPLLLARLAEGERIVEEALQAAGYEEFPFRLRLGETGGLELHLGRELYASLSVSGLENMLAAEGFSCISARVVPALSGYFDRIGDGPET
jgi:uncharacterized protein